MKLEGLAVHPEAKSLLEQFVKRPSHAAVLTGPVGIGKSCVAQHVAIGLLGTSVEARNNPYLRVVVPVKNTITIDQIRQFIPFFRLRVPGNAAVKRVVVIEDADRMGSEAQNALLKLLEEPPEGSILLLTSSHVLTLLPTIRSRVQQITLPAPSADTLLAHFEAAGYPVTDVQAAIRRYGNNVAAISHHLAAGSTAPDDTLDLVKKVLGSSAYDRMLAVDGLAKQKDQAGAFVDTLAAVATASLESAAQHKAGTLSRWQGVLQAAYAAQDALELNGNTKLVLTELMLDV